VEPSLASPPAKVVLDQMAAIRKALSAAESHKMSKQTGTDAPDAAPPHPHTPRQVDAPDDVGREEIDSIDDPDGEEDVEGYGHGV
jgi:hypothetical protein